MCERLKQSVLKTDVPERVPGVRIPLPPPHSLKCREIRPDCSGNYAKWVQFRNFLSKRSRERGVLTPRRGSRACCRPTGNNPKLKAAPSLPSPAHEVRETLV